MLAYRLRATQNKMLNLSLSLALWLFPSPNTPSLPFPCFQNLFISFCLFSPFHLFCLLACNLFFASPFLYPSPPFFSFSVCSISSFSNLPLFPPIPKVSFHTATFSSSFHPSHHFFLSPFLHPIFFTPPRTWPGLAF